MEKNLSTFNFRKVPLAFLITLSLCFLGQAVLVQSKGFWQACYFYSHPGMDDALRLEAQLSLMPANHQNKRIFLAGSSQTREDFDVSHLNNVFKNESMEFFNLGTSGAAEPIEMFMIEDSFFEKNPDVIVYMPFVGSFYGDYNFSKMKYYFHPKAFPNILKHLGTRGVLVHRGAFIESFLSELSIFLKYRESFRAVSATWLKDYLSQGEKFKPVQFAYSTSLPSAYFDDAIKKSQGNQYKRTIYTELHRETFILSAKRIVSSKVKFVVIDAPVHPKFKKTLKKKIDDEYHSFLSEQADKIGFVFLKSDALPGFTEDDFIDFTHLNEKGRKKMTAFIEKYFEKI